MVEIQIILQSMEQRRSALSEAGNVNKQIIFDSLAANGFTRVNVTFDGEGDSGQIENLSGFIGDTLSKLPDVKLTLRAVNWSNEISADERTMAQAIEQLCYDFLEQEHGGWENNDGAFGEFTLNVAERTVELEFNGRYSETYTHNHTF